MVVGARLAGLCISETADLQELSHTTISIGFTEKCLKKRLTLTFRANFWYMEERMNESNLYQAKLQRRQMGEHKSINK